MKNTDFMWFGWYLIGPHPETNEPNRWLYWPNPVKGQPPIPLTAADNEEAEKTAAEIFNRGFD
jgi:hypothetical protein